MALMSVIAGAVLAVLPVAPGPVAPGPVAPPDLWLCRWHLPPVDGRFASPAPLGCHRRLQLTFVYIAELACACGSVCGLLEPG